MKVLLNVLALGLSLAAAGLGSLGPEGKSAEAKLYEMLEDPSPVVRLAAAKALCRIGAKGDVLPVAMAALKHESPWIRLRAAVVIELLGNKGKPALPAIHRALKKTSRFGYENRLLDRLVEQFDQ